MEDMAKEPSSVLGKKLTPGQIAVYGVVSAVWIGFLTLSLLQQPDNDSPYRFTELQRILLQLTIAVPYLFIWLAAFFGALQLRAYQASLVEGEHRRAFLKIGDGLLWLALSLPITSMVSSIRNQPTLDAAYPALTILLNHLYVLFPLIGFYRLFIGARILAKEAGAELKTRSMVLMAISAAAVAAVQLFFMFTDTARNVAPEGGHATFYLPDPLLVTDYVIPTAFSIVFAVLAASYLGGFLKKSAAVIYEKSLPPLIWGLTLIMTSTIILQLLLSLGSTRLLALGLGAILLIVYVFLGIQVAGYLLVAQGTGRLARLQATLARYQTHIPTND